MSDDAFERFLADFEKRAQAFDNRTIYERLTPEILAAIPDDEVEVAIVDYVHKKLASRPDEEARVLEGLSAGVRAAYVTWVVDNEVKNGGFNQFFWNPSRAHAADAVAAFTLFELPEVARLMQDAIALHAKESARLAKFEQRGSLEAFSESYQDNPINQLDGAYYQAAKDLRARRIALIRKHPALFAGE